MKSNGCSRILLLLIALNLVHGFTISPKLDFGETGVVEVKKEIKTGKIKGLRVTVDTSELKESKSSNSESSSSSDSSENKKTVGVRTDVTFEITSDEVGGNATKTVDEKEIGKEDENNASIPVVPVFKGSTDRGGSTKDPLSNEILSVIPLENPAPPPPPTPPRGPIFHTVPDNRNFYGADESGWKQFPQYAIWTTERYNRRFEQPPVFHHRGDAGNSQFEVYKKPSNFIPYQIHHDEHRLHHPWETCSCKEYPGPLINPQQPASHEFKQTNKVDDKLERPFSKTS